MSLSIDIGAIASEITDAAIKDIRQMPRSPVDPIKDEAKSSLAQVIINKIVSQMEGIQGEKARELRDIVRPITSDEDEARSIKLDIALGAIERCKEYILGFRIES